MIFNFIWEKTERIKRNTLIGNITKGGFSMVDIDFKLKSLKEAWIPRFLNSKGILLDNLSNQCKKLNNDIHFLLKCSTNKTESLDSIKLPLFYKEILCCFNECKLELHFGKRSPDDILQYGTIVIEYIREIPFSLKTGLNQE